MRPPTSVSTVRSIPKMISCFDLPFKSWNCITLQLAHRDVDLVIKNEMDLEILLKFLIYNLKTVDGNKNTALKYA